jgi:hypothetical protein
MSSLKLIVVLGATGKLDDPVINVFPSNKPSEKSADSLVTLPATNQERITLNMWCQDDCSRPQIFSLTRFHQNSRTLRRQRPLRHFWRTREQRRRRSRSERFVRPPSCYNILSMPLRKSRPKRCWCSPACKMSAGGATESTSTSIISSTKLRMQSMLLKPMLSCGRE